MEDLFRKHGPYTEAQRTIMTGGRAVPAMRYIDRGPIAPFPFTGHMTVREADEKMERDTLEKANG